ncbi:MAG: 3-carboxyethylcatechol 2,3-dioxygenase [Pseudonocardia sp.]|uniref:3-carboxyethylcatechol 2,3-dioxygenase n=1 Tax=unclassified Pseudonocardia TaxID=2619320 RepID=UPI00086A49DC|nr:MULTISPECIES: 3-carboxyethylcatechol 2,3-dioxygenase [unclassified Pseudonocardia]MBN9112399.1 3-carboxyethylcatechol 2,3-dioxygenase [Pseudonocardia sp.]ODU27329.1 MAG: 3-(2,3-dihydroxyphenyl)propionate dioxygenase [Pseudonocardia sp. SCN 72-51]ODV08942.1 MAG: 3-(2,3-dihydroxyphenyl)propionate dioxygenase [Pseudonocardia sp. SCN 73-27]
MASDLALCCMSHSPLMHTADPGESVARAVADALRGARAFVDAFDPDLVVVFGPDHYQGFRYELMPPFCVGTAATAIGDYGTSEGPLDVPQDLADDLIAHLLNADLDVAMSEKMVVDHGISQPLEVLLGSSAAQPVIPVFLNSVAEPLGPLRRVRRLGHAVGEWTARLDRRVLFVGSGGLSHDVPIPRLREAPPEAAAYLIDRRRTPAEQQAREELIHEAGQAFARGESPLMDLNPELDRELLGLFATGELAAFDELDVGWLGEQGGSSIHEVRSWIAAHAALRTAGPYRTESTFYQPIREWIIGFGITTASSGGEGTT